MVDFILLEGDTVNFLPNFGTAMVVVQPGRLQASAFETCLGRKVCVVGDEKKVSVPGCSYMTPQYSIPGIGTLKIASLAGDQKAQKKLSGGKPVMLKGSQFQAAFEIQMPAQQPPPGGGSPIPDPTPQYSGAGMFVTTNHKYRGS